MSSLKATQADGFYRPPAYFDSGSYKKKSLNQYVGSKGHNQFLTKSIVRFELPYDGICLTCQEVASKGTRFNASKVHVDNYFSSKIFEFTMKCNTCKQEFQIRNDPKHFTFAYVSGIKRKVEEFDTIEAQSIGVIDTDNGNAITSNSEVSLTSINPLSKLETRIAGERKALSDRDSLEFLIKHNHNTSFDDGANNSMLRSVYRSDRKAKKRRFESASKLGLGESFELYDHLSEDQVQAKLVFKHKSSSSSVEKEKRRFRNIRTESVFSSKGKGSKDREKSTSVLFPKPIIPMSHGKVVDEGDLKKSSSSMVITSSLQMLSGYGSDVEST